MLQSTIFRHKRASLQRPEPKHPTRRKRGQRREEKMVRMDTSPIIPMAKSRWLSVLWCLIYYVFISDFWRSLTEKDDKIQRNLDYQCFLGQNYKVGHFSCALMFAKCFVSLFLTEVPFIAVSGIFCLRRPLRRHLCPPIL